MVEANSLVGMNVKTCSFCSKGLKMFCNYLSHITSTNDCHLDSCHFA